MNSWIWIVVFAGLFALLLLLRRRGRIADDEAQALLRSGALVIDVRTPAEFGSGHLSQAINIPLGEVESGVPRRAPEKDTALLLHCQSGMRSATAQGQLRALGYTRTYNLGSYDRARRIVERVQGH